MPTSKNGTALKRHERLNHISREYLRGNMNLDDFRRAESEDQFDYGGATLELARTRWRLIRILNKLANNLRPNGG